MARRVAIPFDFGHQPPARAARGPALVARPHTAQLRFALPRPAQATVAVFDATGGLVRTILAGELASGEHACAWDGLDHAGSPATAGAYVVRLQVAGAVLTSRSVTIG
jgi:hypothetical protein